MKEEIEFDFDEILDRFRSGEKLTGKGGVLAPLIKQLTEAALEAEVESHIVNDVLTGTRNRHNGSNIKATLKPTLATIHKKQKRAYAKNSKRRNSLRYLSYYQQK